MITPMIAICSMFLHSGGISAEAVLEKVIAERRALVGEVTLHREWNLGDVNLESVMHGRFGCSTYSIEVVEDANLARGTRLAFEQDNQGRAPFHFVSDGVTFWVRTDLIGGGIQFATYAESFGYAHWNPKLLGFPRGSPNQADLIACLRRDGRIAEHTRLSDESHRIVIETDSTHGAAGILSLEISESLGFVITNYAFTGVTPDGESIFEIVGEVEYGQYNGVIYPSQYTVSTYVAGSLHASERFQVIAADVCHLSDPNELTWRDLSPYENCTFVSYEATKPHRVLINGELVDYVSE